MRVRAKTSFVWVSDDGTRTIVAHDGLEFEMPEGMDWLKVGFVEAVKEKPEVAVLPAAETATGPGFRQAQPAQPADARKKAVKREAKG